MSVFREHSGFWLQLKQDVGNGAGTQLWVVILVLTLKQHERKGSGSLEPLSAQIVYNPLSLLPADFLCSYQAHFIMFSIWVI